MFNPLHISLTFPYYMFQLNDAKNFHNFTFYKSDHEMKFKSFIMRNLEIRDIINKYLGIT